MGGYPAQGRPASGGGGGGGASASDNITIDGVTLTLGEWTLLNL